MAPHGSEGVHSQRHKFYRLSSEWRSLAEQPRWLVVSWVLLLFISGLALILYIVATPIYFARLSTVRADCNDECRPIRPADEIYNAKLTAPLSQEETSEEQE